MTRPRLIIGGLIALALLAALSEALAPVLGHARAAYLAAAACVLVPLGWYVYRDISADDEPEESEEE
jgi:hypothetical protein